MAELRGMPDDEQIALLKLATSDGGMLIRHVSVDEPTPAGLWYTITMIDVMGEEVEWHCDRACAELAREIADRT